MPDLPGKFLVYVYCPSYNSSAHMGSQESLGKLW